MSNLMSHSVSSSEPIVDAVQVRDAYKKYASTVVFEGLDMTLKEGTIYCLLGPSGCGKTTLLNCIVGRSFLNSGHIKLNICQRSELGYMPQATCLYQNLSVYETFFLFGYIFGMSHERILKRANELIEFLNIPSGTRQVKTFRAFLIHNNEVIPRMDTGTSIISCGGEQRRVSVAVTFLHNPKMLVLDEPTVGLDPLLCQHIWEYFIELSARGKTILITTHYIQEACRAHTVGLMRNGVLIAEDKPSHLLSRYETDNLELVFLRLCAQQERNPTTKAVSICGSSNSDKVFRTSFRDDNTMFSVTKFNAINYKNTMVLKHAFIFVIFLFLLPFSQIYFFNIVIGRKPKNLPIAIVNDEMSLSECFRTSNHTGCILQPNQSVHLSCLYLDAMKNESYKILEFRDTVSGLKALKKNSVWALLYFGQNYTQSLISRYSFGRYATDEDLKSSDIVTWIDLSNQYIGNFIKLDVARFSSTLMQQAFLNCHMNKKLGAPPLSMETPIYGRYDEEFVSYAASATLGLCCFFMPFLLTGGLIFVEKNAGILERLMVTGVSMKEMLVSIMLFQVIVHSLQVCGLMLLNYVIFNNSMHGNVLTLCTLLLTIGISGALFGLMLAGLSNNIHTISFTGIGTNLLLILTSGVVWPVEAHHYTLKVISDYIPLTQAVKAIRAISAKSFPFTHPEVVKGFLSIFGWAFVFLFVIYLTTKSKKNAWVIQK